MTDIKVVLGANFGDEGKGLLVDSFCSKSKDENKSTIVVMSNGGAQRGHTVNLPDGIRHTFRHFGSGTFSGADTYCCDRFIVNPMIFRDEYNALGEIGYTPTLYMESNCRWTTPFDMIINQIIENHRGENRHGSCGVGIWETCVRYEKECTYTLHQFNALPIRDKISYLKRIRDIYLPQRLKELGVTKIPYDWQFIMSDDNYLIPNFITDVEFMCSHCNLGNRLTLHKYNTIVFENGQGLLLDQNAYLYGDNTTPSNTGSYNAVDIITRYFNPKEINVEMCYVTRTYMTRHGAGRFETECSKDLLNPFMYDETNKYHDFQGSLRYGELIIDNLVKRCNNDLNTLTCAKFNWKASIAVTHTNELQLDYSAFKQGNISNIYISNSKYADSVKVFNEF